MRGWALLGAGFVAGFVTGVVGDDATDSKVVMSDRSLVSIITPTWWRCELQLGVL